jgi:multisubunit Na+/H+ antiporter MnhB subunit
MLKSARGYSLNIGNSIAKFSAAYVVGFAVLMFVLTHMAP